MELDKKGIAQGRTKEEIQQREKVIKNFYVAWNEANPEKRVYNVNLQAFIYVKFLSFQETVEKASRSYKSTLAVTYLTDILELAAVVNYTKPKEGNKKQSRFSDIIIMQYNKANFGKIKLTVGILRGNREKIQYCITAIEKSDCTTRNIHAIVIQSLFFICYKGTNNFLITKKNNNKIIIK